MTLRAVCYPRVSTTGQRDRHTIASQLRLLPEFVARMGWTLVKPVETYVDDGFTAKAGKLAQRRGYEALLRDMMAGLFDVVVVISIDRLTRSEDMAERGAILGAFQRLGVKVADAMSGQVLDFGTDMGDLLGSLQAVWASMERRKIREKTMEGRITAAHRNKKPQGPTPYGLAYSRETGEWSIDPVRGPFMVEIVERVAAGESAKSIADDFNARGVPAPRDVWERGRIRQLAKSRHTIGEWIANRERNLVVKVPVLVPVELWEQAQRSMNENRTRTPMVHTKHVYLLERMATCAVCGSSIVIRSPIYKGKKHSRYVCLRRKQCLHDRVRCEAPTIRVDEADAKVWEEVAAAIRDPKLARRILDIRTADAENERNWKADLAGYRKHLARLQSSESAIVARFQRGLLTERTMDESLRSLKRERDGVQAQLEHAESASRATAATQAELDTLETRLEELRDLADNATAAEKRELVRRFVEPGSVTIHGKEIRFTLWIRRGKEGVSEQRSSTRTPQGDALRIRLVV